MGHIITYLCLVEFRVTGTMIWDKNWGCFSNLFNFSVLGIHMCFNYFQLRSEPWNPNLGPGFFSAWWWWRCRCSPFSIWDDSNLPSPDTFWDGSCLDPSNSPVSVFGAGHIPMVCTCLYWFRYWFQASATKGLGFWPMVLALNWYTDMPCRNGHMSAKNITWYQWFSWFPMTQRIHVCYIW